MASLLPLRVFIYLLQMFTAGVRIVVMLNCQNARGSVGATPEHGPSETQLTLDLNRDYLLGGRTKPELGANPGQWMLLLSKSCSQPEVAK
jgi:hypothetical protein